MDPESFCQYPVTVMDFRPPLNFSQNITKIEADYPCQLRMFWVGIHVFVEITRALLFYGTSAIILLGVTLNTLSFYILMSSGLAKNGSGIYLLVLAMCDSGNLLFNYAVGVARGQIPQFNTVFKENEWLCRIHGVLVELFQLYSAWIVVGFTMERCLIVWYPMTMRRVRKYRSKLVLSAFGIVFTALALSKLFLTGFEGDSVFGYSACKSKRHKWDGMVYVGVAFQTWIPTFLVSLFNGFMFYKLKKIKTNRNKLTASRNPRPNNGERHRGFFYRPSATTPMLVAVSLAYLILVFPLGIVQTVELQWKVVNRNRPTDQQLYVDWRMTQLLLKFIRSVCFCFYQLNFCINFFLYFASGVQFRAHLLYKLRCWWKFLRCKCYSRSQLEATEHSQSNAKSLISQVHSSSLL